MFNTKIYKRPGGGEMVVADGGKLIVQTGGAIVPNSEVQPSHIADVSLATVAWTTGDKAKVNSIIAILEGIGAAATA